MKKTTWQRLTEAERLTAFARFMGCTLEQVQSGLRRNARQLRGMAEQARRTGRLVNGFTAEQLEQSAARAEKL